MYSDSVKLRLNEATALLATVACMFVHCSEIYSSIQAYDMQYRVYMHLQGWLPFTPLISVAI